MGSFLVTWTGTNKILDIHGHGVVLKNSLVKNHGYIAIEDNTEGGILLYSDCLLLLSNNSVLKVYNNRAKGIFTAGLAIVGTRKGTQATNLQLWPESDWGFFNLWTIRGGISIALNFTTSMQA